MELTYEEEIEKNTSIRELYRMSFSSYIIELIHHDVDWQEEWHAIAEYFTHE